MPSNRKPSAVIAEALRSIAAELDEQRNLLEQILEVCRTTADGLSEHRAHTINQVDALGQRVRQLETRLGR